MTKETQRKQENNFILFTIVTSALLAVLYFLKSWKDGFLLIGWVIIGLNLLYIPYSLVFRKKGFPYFYIVYSVVLLYAAAFERTFLYNNYTALFILCLVIMMQPKFGMPSIILYFILVTIAFIFNDEPLYLYFIHIVRSVWYIGIVQFVLNDKFRRKKLVLYEDERRILDQMCEGKVYQKEVEGFSENTIYRKLKAARQRNGNLTREQLINEYRKEKEAKELENS